MLLKVLAGLLLSVSGAGGIPVSTAVPEPALAPGAWELKFRYQDPQKISVVVPGQREPVVYWYMLYTVQNPTGREVDFYPKFELVTDTLQVIESEVRVSPEAFRAIKRRSGNPLLVTPEAATGKLLQGEDRQRHSVAIWRNVDPKARAFTVYVAGLSGEMTRLRNPAFNAEEPESAKNQRYFNLRKTLAIPYRLPGGESTRNLAVPERLLGEEKWIMR
jgi:hypothetical protein